MRTSLLHFAAVGIVVGSIVGLSAQEPQQAALSHALEPPLAQTAAPPVVQHMTSEAADNPVADPRSVVVMDNARFTVLTPELIRMEWAADGKFEDHASFVFINRRLPVPKFGKQYEAMGTSRKLTIKTDALTLTYNWNSTTGADTRFTPENLKIELTVDGKPVTWHPGLTDPENLQGTTRTLDGARGSKTHEPIEQGLVSRSGWALVDDSTRPLFDSANFSFAEGEKSPWPWVIERPAGERQDWYFFGYGHEYRKALGDYIDRKSVV